MFTSLQTINAIQILECEGQLHVKKTLLRKVFSMPELTNTSYVELRKTWIVDVQILTKRVIFHRETPCSNFNPGRNKPRLLTLSIEAQLSLV